MAVGIRPNMQLAKEAGITVNRGIVVDATMRTSDPDIFALGECAEADGQVFGLVAPLYEMANTAAAQLVGDASASFKSSATATKLKVTGINLYSAGDFAEAKDREEIVLRDATRGVYRRLVLKDNRVIGAVMYGDTSDGPWFFDLLKRGTDVADMRETLIFGQNYAGGIPLDPAAADRGAARRCRDLRLQRRLQGQDHGRHRRPRAEEPRRGPGAYQGVGVVRLLHRPGRAAPEGPARRGLQSRRRPADVRLHRSRPRRRAPADRRQGAEVDPAAHAGAGVEDLVRLRQVPAGAELLHAVQLARRVCRRQPVALHQRARPRQHPEGRHLLGRAAHVGRPDQRQGTARHRRHRRQVQDPDGQGHRRPAHRHAGRRQGGPARRVGRSRAPPAWSRATPTPRACAR